MSFVNSASVANLVIDVSMSHRQFQQYKENIETHDKHENLTVGTKQVADDNGNTVDQPV
ncbi:hypothetical protein [Snodgrassella communis]|uniref:hypothetical protein n=1 Tax=Snodgrassella communis TaxID=2946699 RepID=UPI001EF66A49|nr:hypothetical protein [Snodgrassella communis]WMY91843.1 hypothetical protein PYG29_00180 [Snodgrassella communis]